MEQEMGGAHAWEFVRFRTCFHLILASHVWLLLNRTAGAQVEGASEVAALLSFRSWSGYPSPDLPFMLWESWNESDKTPCAWAGVACDSDSFVYGLDFSRWGMPLSSVQIDELSILKRLTRLDSSSNYAPKLVQFDYHDVTCEDYRFSNALPYTIGNLKNLTYLDLSGNCFTGEIKANISACKNLRELHLQGNRLEGRISALAGLRNLETLSLANNQVNGSIADLGDMPALLTMDFSNNRVTGTVPDLSNFPALEILILDNNYITHLGPSFFTSARALRHLSISGNQLKGGIPPTAGNMLNIQLLNLSRNELSGPIPSEIGRQSSSPEDSFTLDLSQNSLTGSMPARIIGHPVGSRVTLDVSHNHLTGSIASILEQLCHATHVSVFLDLSHNDFSEPVPFFCSGYGVSDFQIFKVNDNQLSGDIVDILVNRIVNSGMDELHLQNNQFTGDMSRIIAAPKASWFNSTVVLDMSNNNLTWSISEDVRDPLRVMLEKVGHFSQFLVGGNNFSGISLPAGLLPGSSLTVLDLSNSHLTGQISGAAFNNATLPNVVVLNLSNNAATGPIPPETYLFLRRPSFEVFDVSNNQLSGCMSFIKPGSRIYNPSFFAGNSQLCGGFLVPCQPSKRSGVPHGVPRWVVYVIIAVSTTMFMVSFLAAAWRWRVYKRRHQQDEELIRTLLEGESTVLMSLRKLKRATNNFAESAHIGEGGFGKVYKGELSDGTVVAIKRSKREGYEKEREQFLNEVRILCQLNHRYLVKLLGCCLENKIALLVFEFVSNGTLQEHLQRKFGGSYLSWKQRLNIAVQTADALNYLHSAATVPIYHRDVKSANILLNDALNAKVADFGISKLVPGEVTHVSTVAVLGTMGYIDPEYFTSYKLNERSDVYSFGVVLLELISAKPAIDFQRPEEESSLVMFAKPHIESGDLEGLVDPSLLETYRDGTGQWRESILGVGKLAVRCLNMTFKARPSMQEVLKELQNLWCVLELEGPSLYLESIREDDIEDPHHDFIDLPFGSPFDNRSSWSSQNGTTGVEMSEFSR